MLSNGCSLVPFFYLHASCRSNFLIYIIWPVSGWLKLPPFVSFCCRFIEFVLNGFDCVPTTMLNILPCVNFNSIRWKKASLCASTGWFVKLCWQLERRRACQSDLFSTVDTRRAEARASAAWRWFKMMSKHLWHILRSTKSLSFSPVIHSSDDLWAHPWLAWVKVASSLSSSVVTHIIITTITMLKLCMQAVAAFKSFHLLWHFLLSCTPNKRGGEILLLGCQKQMKPYGFLQDSHLVSSTASCLTS